MKNLRKEEGFTLIEMMISLFILSVGLLGMILMQTTAILANKTTNEMIKGTMLAEQVLEQVKGQPFDAIATSAGIDISTLNPNTAAITDTAFPVSQKSVAGGMTFYQAWSVSGADPKQITAYVLWQDRYNSWHQVALKTGRSSR
jgi:type IV pilus assembly protein PilV